MCFFHFRACAQSSKIVRESFRTRFSNESRDTALSKDGFFELSSLKSLPERAPRCFWMPPGVLLELLNSREFAHQDPPGLTKRGAQGSPEEPREAKKWNRGRPRPPQGDQYGPLGGTLGATWELLGATSELLAAFWGQIGASRAHCGFNLELLGVFFDSTWQLKPLATKQQLK